MRTERTRKRCFKIRLSLSFLSASINRRERAYFPRKKVAKHHGIRTKIAKEPTEKQPLF